MIRDVIAIEVNRTLPEKYKVTIAVDNEEAKIMDKMARNFQDVLDYFNKNDRENPECLKSIKELRNFCENFRDPLLGSLAFYYWGIIQYLNYNYKHAVKYFHDAVQFAGEAKLNETEQVIVSLWYNCSLFYVKDITVDKLEKITLKAYDQAFAVDDVVLKNYILAEVAYLVAILAELEDDPYIKDYAYIAIIEMGEAAEEFIAARRAAEKLEYRPF